MNSKQELLFEIDKQEVFKTALEKYGTWPQTVWEINCSSPLTKRTKGHIGDENGQVRQNQNKSQRLGFRKNLNSLQSTGKNSCYGVKDSFVHVSIFNPQICANILNMFAPKQGLCFDPFAGGGTRALMTNAFGLKYEGVEIRKEEVNAVIGRCESAGIEKGIKIIHGDSRNLKDHFRNNIADFLLTCPPYWNLEKYDGGVGDLSMLNDYKQFINEMALVVQECYRILKPGALACWVVGLHRHSDGWLAPLNHDIARLHLDAGFKIKEEIILVHKNNGAIQRVGNFEKGKKILIRTHEYCLVFSK